MFKPLARLVCRDGGKTDGLMIGLRLTDENNFFKPGYCYDVMDVMGVPTIKEVGPSAVKPTKKDYKRWYHPPACWGNSIDMLVTCLQRHLLLTEEEYEAEAKKDERENGG